MISRGRRRRETRVNWKHNVRKCESKSGVCREGRFGSCAGVGMCEAKVWANFLRKRILKIKWNHLAPSASESFYFILSVSQELNHRKSLDKISLLAL